MQRFESFLSGVYGRLETICLPLKKVYSAATKTTTSSIITITLLVIFSFFSVAFYSFCINPSLAVTIKSVWSWPKPAITSEQALKKNRVHYFLNCTTTSQTKTCPKNITLVNQEYQSPSSSSCPDYFSWIQEDLRPWKETGITIEMIERARKTANFRLVILNGKAYVEIYSPAFQTRDVFTWWGIIQLLKMYPGKLPDLDLMFDCDDQPVISSSHYKEKGPNATAPPPLFRYCGSEETLDIPFPDWSFWGWPEVNIKPWKSLLKELKEGNQKVKWLDREPYAYWKGNPYVSRSREDLMKCNVSPKQDWKARLYSQDWGAEQKKGYKHSNLAEQCTHRYKIYIEGRGWSVSEKYILACDSPTLLVRPKYYDTFTRSLVPLQHYWPITVNDKCRSIEFAVDWGNKHKKKAQKIGKTGSNFIDKDMSMEYVYDYMFHVLNEYAKLLRFKPSKPEKAIEFCSESMACPADGLVRTFMMESMVNSPSDTMPCNLPPPIDPQTRQSLIRRKENLIKKVELWQNKH